MFNKLTLLYWILIRLAADCSPDAVSQHGPVSCLHPRWEVGAGGGGGGGGGGDGGVGVGWGAGRPLSFNW